MALGQRANHGPPSSSIVHPLFQCERRLQQHSRHVRTFGYAKHGHITFSSRIEVVPDPDYFEVDVLRTVVQDFFQSKGITVIKREVISKDFWGEI